MAYIIRIPGKPLAKGRPRFTKGGHTYTPDKTVEYENLVKLSFARQYPDAVPTDEPVIMAVRAEFPIPESWSKKKKQLARDGAIAPGKPDWDNIGKIISDALNGIAYKDDAQIHQAIITKEYGDNPHVLVVLMTEEDRGKEMPILCPGMN